MKKSIRTVLLCLMGAVLLLSGCGGKREELPDAGTQFYVLDEPGVLDQATEEYIVSVNDSLNAQTGAQVVVVCVQTTGLASTDEYAYELFNKWKIGDKKKNNGVLLLLTVGEVDYWMMPGKGLEDSLSSGVIKLMLDRYLEPDFAVGDYDAGVRKTFDAVVEHLETMYSVTVRPDFSVSEPAESGDGGEEVPYRESSDISIIGWAIIIVIVILLIISFSSGGGGNHRRRRHVTHSSPRPRRTSYPYGTRMPRRTQRPTMHRPGSYGGTIGRSRGSYGGTIGGGYRPGSYRPGGSFGGSSRSGGSFGGGSRSGGGGFSRGGGAGRR